MLISADFKKVAEIGKSGFKNTSFTLTNKALNMAISVSRFINIHKLRCPMIHNYWNFIILVFIKVLKN